MTVVLRPYQRSAVAEVGHRWQQGVNAVCLVAPCGAGKTVLARQLIADHVGPVLAVAHRRELVTQMADRLREWFGFENVGVVMPGYDRQPLARIQVASIETLTARDMRPPATLLVPDEAHHYKAATYLPIVEHYRATRIVGLTATPQRADGSPLGDIFQGLVVAANYSDLLKDGYLVPCRVLRPPEWLGSDLANNPLPMYQKHGGGGQCFAFCGSVIQAEKLAADIQDADIPAACVTAKTPQPYRDSVFAAFRSGELRVLTNVGVLTEGVDVPAASVCLLARQCTHASTYLQIVGRVLRPAPDKTEAVLIDLPGATIAHGFPTEDRLYSLDGEGIKRTSQEALRNCLQCGACIPVRFHTCPECGFVFPVKKQRGAKIYSLELVEAYAGEDTPEAAQRIEYETVREMGRRKGWKLYAVQRHMRVLFKRTVLIHDATIEEQRAEWRRLEAIRLAKGYKPGFSKVRFKDIVGKWPGREVTGA